MVQAILGTKAACERAKAAAITNVTRYTAEQVDPPEGVKSEDWIKSGLAR